MSAPAGWVIDDEGGYWCPNCMSRRPSRALPPPEPSLLNPTGDPAYTNERGLWWLLAPVVGAVFPAVLAAEMFGWRPVAMGAVLVASLGCLWWPLWADIPETHGNDKGLVKQWLKL